ncbi:hypothetical protein FD688_01170 [Apilactobacillus kunkeei]|uniref:hypothetical protein n=1 Tax=Apilactobacillus kunkeei TaxID=148814 RepID=UPI00110C9C16|nr:hypothetical protein [Apilactobacillus kunkeei]TMT01693.1 hypothetical protein FD688_01170 [Apilactobacillus kunkeei]
MKKMKTVFKTIKEWTFLIVLIAVVGAVIGMVRDVFSNSLSSHSWHDFLVYSIISAIGGIILIALYFVYSVIAERIHKKHPTWFAPQDPPSKR